MAKERVAYIDMAAGIMILFMMLGHLGGCRLGYDPAPVFYYMRRVFFFFMPWFFYKSGMFFSVNEQSNRGGDKLLIPFAIWSFVGYAVYAITQLICGTMTICQSLLTQPLKFALFENLLPCNKPLWFLLTLFLVINISNIALKKIHPLILSTISLLIGYSFYLVHNEYIPDIIANTATGLCFFCLGFWLQGKEMNRWLIIGASIGYILSILLLHSPFVDMRENICLANKSGFDYLLWFPSSLCGIIVLNSFCSLVIKLYRFPIMQYLGKNAMSFLVTHYIVFYIIGYVLYYIFDIFNGRTLWYITLVIGVVIVPIVALCVKQLSRSIKKI